MRIIFSGIFLVFAFSCYAQTPCPLPRSGRDQIELARATVKSMPQRPGLQALEALAWLEYACPEGAANALRPWLASVSLDSELDDHALEEIMELKGLLAIADAVARERSGQRSDARTTLIAIRETYASDRVHQQATLWLANLLLADGTDPLWPEIENDLARIAQVPGPGWMAKNVLANHWSNSFGAGPALERVHEKLDDSPGLQDSLEFVTISVRLLLDLGKDLDAALLVTGLDREAGAQLLDLRARAEFLRLGAEAWKRRAATGDDSSSSERSRIYAAAYDEATR